MQSLQAGKVFLNPTSKQPLDIKDRGPAVVTLIYLNDVLISFDAALRAVLQSSEVLKSYSLDTEPDDQQQWIVATPEARTEVAALYAQVRIDLPCVESADLQ